MTEEIEEVKVNDSKIILAFEGLQLVASYDEGTRMYYYKTVKGYAFRNDKRTKWANIKTEDGNWVEVQPNTVKILFEERGEE